MKRLFSAILAIILLAGISVPAMAQEASQYWRVTARAHVLDNRADALVVYLTNPDQLNTDAGTWGSKIQHIPLSAETVFVDKSGNPLQQSELLPGQKVRMTFRYTYTTNEWNGSRHIVEPLLGYQIQLREDTIAVASTLDWETLPPDTAIGVITHIDDEGQQDGVGLQIYADMRSYTYENYVYWIGAGDNGAPQGLTLDVLAARRSIGTSDTFIKGNTKIYDAMGKRIAMKDLRPFQRVMISGEPAYGGFNGCSLEDLAEVRVLDVGEKVPDSQLVADLDSLRCTVVENRGGEELLVRPAADSWLGREQELWRIPRAISLDANAHTPLFPYRPGDEVIVKYIEYTSERVSPGILTTTLDGVQPIKDSPPT